MFGPSGSGLVSSEVHYEFKYTACLKLGTWFGGGSDGILIGRK